MKLDDIQQAAEARPGQPPFNPHVVAFDTQALWDGAWPRPNARLRQLADVASKFGPHLWLLDGAVAEVRGHRERDLSAASAALRTALKGAQRAGLEASVKCSEPAETLAKWDADHATAVKLLGLHSVPFTERSAAEFFGMAVRRTKPFAENGSGYRDAVLFASLADEMKRRGLVTAILVTRDKDFLGVEALVEGQDIRPMSLDRAIEAFDGLMRANKRALFDSRTERREKDDQVVVHAIVAGANSLERAIGSALEIGQADLPGLPGTLKKPLMYRIAGVQHVSVAPSNDTPKIGEVVDVTAVLLMEGQFEVRPDPPTIEARVALGGDADQARQHAWMAAYRAGLETAVVGAKFLIDCDLRLTRTIDGYKDPEFVECRHLRPSMRGLHAGIGDFAG